MAPAEPAQMRRWHVRITSHQAVADARDLPNFVPVRLYRTLRPVDQTEIGFVECFRLFGIDAEVQDVLEA